MRTVARDRDGDVPFGQFTADVSLNASRFAKVGCRRATLACRDAYCLSVGLFALLYAGARPILPSNLRNGAQGALSEEFDCVVGDDDGATFGLECALADADPLPPLDPRQAVIGFCTSGTTGEPKLVNKPLLMLEREIAVLDGLWGSEPGGTQVMATVPSHHVYGLTFAILWPLSAGRPFARRTRELWEEVATDMPPRSVLVTGPSHLSRIAGMMPLPPDRRPRMVLSAGATLPTAAAREASAVLGVPVTEILGSSETGVIAHRICDGTEHPWRMFPGVDTEIAEGGVLRVRSPFLTDDGWHETGDVAEATADGFRLCGRMDRLAKIEGKRVSLAEIERHLTGMPSVLTAAVTVLPGEPAVLGAAVVLTEDGRAELARLGAFRLGRMLRQALSSIGEPTAMPRRWRFPDRLPVDAMGKRRDADIVALFAEVGNDSVDIAARRDPEVRAVRPLGDGVELDLFLAADLLPFRGHFPGVGVLPGVAQINWAVKFARRHLSLTDGTAPAFQVKFRRVIGPDSLVTLALRMDIRKRRLLFEYRVGDEVMSSGSIPTEAA